MSLTYVVPLFVFAAIFAGFVTAVAIRNKTTTASGKRKKDPVAGSPSASALYGRRTTDVNERPKAGGLHSPPSSSSYLDADKKENAIVRFEEDNYYSTEEEKENDESPDRSRDANRADLEKKLENSEETLRKTSEWYESRIVALEKDIFKERNENSKNTDRVKYLDLSLANERKQFEELRSAMIGKQAALEEERRRHEAALEAERERYEKNHNKSSRERDFPPQPIVSRPAEPTVSSNPKVAVENTNKNEQKRLSDDVDRRTNNDRINDDRRLPATPPKRVAGEDSRSHGNGQSHTAPPVATPRRDYPTLPTPIRQPQRDHSPLEPRRHETASPAVRHGPVPTHALQPNRDPKPILVPDLRPPATTTTTTVPQPNNVPATRPAVANDVAPAPVLPSPSLSSSSSLPIPLPAGRITSSVTGPSVEKRLEREEEKPKTTDTEPKVSATTEKEGPAAITRSGPSSVVPIEQRFVRRDEITHDDRSIDVSTLSVVMTPEITRAVESAVGSSDIANRYCVLRIPNSALPVGSSKERKVKKSLVVGENEKGKPKRFARMKIVTKSGDNPASMVFHDFTPVVYERINYDFVNDKVTDGKGCDWKQFSVQAVYLGTEKLDKISAVEILVKSSSSSSSSVNKNAERIKAKKNKGK